MPILSKPKYKMKNLLRIRNLMVLILMSYFLYGIISGLRQQSAIYPMFSWFLFDRTPNTVQWFSVIIYEWDGNKLVSPLPWHKAMESISGTSPAGARFYFERSLVQKIGNAYINGDKNKFAELRKDFEKIFLENKTAKYQIIEETYNPIEKWKFGDSKVVRKSIGFFQIK